MCETDDKNSVNTIYMNKDKTQNIFAIQNNKQGNEKPHEHVTNLACTLIRGSDSFSKCTTLLPDCAGYETERIQVLADECDDKSATTGTCRWVPE